MSTYRPDDATCARQIRTECNVEPDPSSPARNSYSRWVRNLEVGKVPIKKVENRLAKVDQGQ